MFKAGDVYNITEIRGDNEGDFNYIGSAPENTDMYKREHLNQITPRYITDEGWQQIFAADTDYEYPTFFTIKNKHIPKYEIYRVEMNYPEIEDYEFKCEWERDEMLKEFVIQHFIAESARYNLNYDFLQDNREGTLKSNIKVGLLTSLVSKTGIDRRKMTAELMDFIRLWYSTARNVAHTLRIASLNYEPMNWCFYRTVKDRIVLNDYVQPIPTSYTTSLTFAKSWLQGLISCCILRVELPMGSPLTFLEEHTDNPDDKSQSEVVLPAGKIIVQDRRMYQEKVVVLCRLEPWSEEQCIEYIKNNLI